jgi:hypothetical protein
MQETNGLALLALRAVIAAANQSEFSTDRLPWRP